MPGTELIRFGCFARPHQVPQRFVSRDDVTYFAQIRGGGLDLVKWKLPHTHDQTMNEATTDEQRYTGSPRSAAR
jgi:hypothetical protein